MTKNWFVGYITQPCSPPNISKTKTESERTEDSVSQFDASSWLAWIQIPISYFISIYGGIRA